MSQIAAENLSLLVDVEQAPGPWDALLACADLDGLLAQAEVWPATDPELEDLLERGHLALLRLDWQDADQLFSRALERRMDTPVALAALAWARLNNPSWPVEARRASAWRLALLASQLAPQDAQVSALLAAFRQAADEDASPLDNACSSAA